jgi:hypothetical protein
VLIAVKHTLPIVVAANITRVDLYHPLKLLPINVTLTIPYAAHLAARTTSQATPQQLQPTLSQLLSVLTTKPVNNVRDSEGSGIRLQWFLDPKRFVIYVFCLGTQMASFIGNKNGWN